jgi:hypothetical protein
MLQGIVKLAFVPDRGVGHSGARVEDLSPRVDALNDGICQLHRSGAR